MTGRTYRLEPRDATGIFLGLGAAECALLGSGMVATLLLRLGGAPILLSAAPALATSGLAKLRLGGHPLYHWLPLVLQWSSTGFTGRRRWRGPLPLLPLAGERGRPAEMPAVLRGIDIVEVPHDGRRLAAVRERRGARLTAVIAVGPMGFAGTDPAAQEALLAGWGEALANAAGTGSAVVQVGWSYNARPGALSEHRGWLESRLDTGQDTDADYASLVDEVAAFATAHETHVWITVSGTSIAGRGKPLDKAAAQLPTAVESLVTILGDAGLDVGQPLAVHGLWNLLRKRCDPFDRAEGGDAAGLAERMGLLGQHNGRPLAVDPAWSELRMDGAWHRTYWIETWPRRPMPADWLAGFLTSLRCATLTVVHRPIDPARSHRRIEGQLVKLSAHRARKEEKARRVTEADRRTEEAAQELEAELTSGYAELLYLGLVDVAAATVEDLDNRSHEVELAARAAQLGLRVLHGRQDVAWAASLPFGLTEPGALDLMGL
jgi:hypothetical protein